LYDECSRGAELPSQPCLASRMLEVLTAASPASRSSFGQDNTNERSVVVVLASRRSTVVGVEQTREPAPGQQACATMAAINTRPEDTTRRRGNRNVIHQAAYRKAPGSAYATAAPWRALEASAARPVPVISPATSTSTVTSEILAHTKAAVEPRDRLVG
jgi:hypothetical protein